MSITNRFTLKQHACFTPVLSGPDLNLEMTTETTKSRRFSNSLVLRILDIKSNAVTTPFNLSTFKNQ